NYVNKEQYDIKYNFENPGIDINPENIDFEDHILYGANELFLSSNTITPQFTGHASLKSGFRLIKAINPERTWIVHYSGHEDFDGPLTDNQLQNWIDINKIKFELNGYFIKVASHGMEINF
ncbi:MAG: hypothetical protein ACFFG0_54265, partial [Candidatus Thorarchaeota archaeon]